MKFGTLSGLLWGLDTVVLGIALAMVPLLDDPGASLASAFLHDAVCAGMLLVLVAVRGKLRQTWSALQTRAGRGVCLAALLGGPVGMTGYLVAINNIGPGYTAVISAFYPAFGAVLAFIFLGERMLPRQLVALMVALGGIIVMGWSSTGWEGGNSFVGILAALLCVVGWGSEAVILAWAMREESVDNETALLIRETTSALVYGILVVPIGGALSTTLATLPTPAMGIIALAALAGSASYLFYYRAIDTIGAARGMALNISYSAWAVFFGFVLMGTVPGGVELVACIVILVATVLSATPDWRDLSFRRHTATPVEAAADEDAAPTTPDTATPTRHN